MKCDQVGAALSIMPALQHSAHRGRRYYLLGQDPEEIVPERGQAQCRFHGNTTSSALVPQMSLSLYLSTPPPQTSDPVSSPAAQATSVSAAPSSQMLCGLAPWGGKLCLLASCWVLREKAVYFVLHQASGVAPTQTLSSSEHKALGPCKPEFLYSKEQGS